MDVDDLLELATARGDAARRRPSPRMDPRRTAPSIAIACRPARRPMPPSPYYLLPYDRAPLRRHGCALQCRRWSPYGPTGLVPCSEFSTTTDVTVTVVRPRPSFGRIFPSRMASLQRHWRRRALHAIAGAPKYVHGASPTPLLARKPDRRWIPGRSSTAKHAGVAEPPPTDRQPNTAVSGDGQQGSPPAPPPKSRISAIDRNAEETRRNRRLRYDHRPRRPSSKPSGNDRPDVDPGSRPAAQVIGRDQPLRLPPRSAGLPRDRAGGEDVGFRPFISTARPRRRNPPAAR